LDSSLRVRGDTFVIRAYGEAVDGPGDNRAEAWCELTVQRMPEPVGYANLAPAERPVELRQPTSAFGRKFEVIDFRWLNKEEL
jgi:hypothetical protein